MAKKKDGFPWLVAGGVAAGVGVLYLILKPKKEEAKVALAPVAIPLGIRAQTYMARINQALAAWRVAPAFTRGPLRTVVLATGPAVLALAQADAAHGQIMPHELVAVTNAIGAALEEVRG